MSTTSGRSISLSCSYRGLFRIFSPSVIRLQLRLPFQVSISRDLVLPVALLPLQLHRDSLCLQRLQLKITLQSASVTGKEEVVKACKGCGPEGKRRRQTENWKKNEFCLAAYLARLLRVARFSACSEERLISKIKINPNSWLFTGLIRSAIVPRAAILFETWPWNIQQLPRIDKYLMLAILIDLTWDLHFE